MNLTDVLNFPFPLINREVNNLTVNNQPFLNIQKCYYKQANFTPSGQKPQCKVLSECTVSDPHLEISGNVANLTSRNAISNRAILELIFF
jgi:hypothetical protein